MQFSSLSNTGLQFHDRTEAWNKGIDVTGEARCFAYSKCGSFLAQASTNELVVFTCTDKQQVVTIPDIKVIEVDFSPSGTYVSTWERWVKSPDSGLPCTLLQDTNPHRNLKLWKVETGEMVLSFSQKNQNGWRLEWTEDERFCARLVGSEVQIYSSLSFSSGIAHRLKLEGMQSFSISPGKRYTIAAFVPERKGQPATVQLYDILNLSTAIAQKTFFRADSAHYYWNDIGTSILVLTHTDVDKTGKSYYGETGLYFLAIAGNFDCRVELDHPGPVHDVNWSPNAKEFMVIYGTMPSKATLFDHRANAIYDFPPAPRNFVRFNPHGRVICIAGFGNLAGEIDLWDRKSLRKIAVINGSNTSYCEWAPDGRHLMTAILYKRLKVDNGIKIWHYRGVLVHELSVKEMYQAAWRPMSVTNFPERSELSPAPAGGTVSQPVAKVGVYRPPGARAGSGFTMNRAELDREPQNGANASPSNGRKKIPGMVPGMTQKQSASAQQPPKIDPAIRPQSAAQKNEKKIKQVTKKLKAIQDIKDKVALGLQVELTQIEKMKNEDALMRELAELTQESLSLLNS